MNKVDIEKLKKSKKTKEKAIKTSKVIYKNEGTNTKI